MKIRTCRNENRDIRIRWGFVQFKFVFMADHLKILIYYKLLGFHNLTQTWMRMNITWAKIWFCIFVSVIWIISIHSLPDSSSYKQFLTYPDTKKQSDTGIFPWPRLSNSFSCSYIQILSHIVFEMCGNIILWQPYPLSCTLRLRVDCYAKSLIF